MITMKSNEIVEGMVFGRLTVIEAMLRVAPSPSHAELGQKGPLASLCRCSCSDETELIVRNSCLRIGTTTSCGCYRREVTAQNNKDNPRFSGLEVEEYFWDDVDCDTQDYDRCWPWLGQILKNGYGTGHLHDIEYTKYMAHRLAYELEVGEITEGLELDHLCHDAKVCNLKSECPHRRCCNPTHLEPVTHTVNVQRSAPNMVRENWR